MEQEIKEGQHEVKLKERSFVRRLGRFALIAVIVLATLVAFVNIAGPQYLKWVDRYEEAKYKKVYDQYIEAQKNDTYGGKTPEETFDLFLEALKKNDAELASKYYIIDNQEKKFLKLKEYLVRDGSLNKSVIYFTDVRSKDKKICHDLDNERAGCNFEYIYITTEDSESLILGTNDRIFIPKGSEGSKMIDLKLNPYANIWKVVQP